MEQILEQVFHGRQTNRLSNVQQNLFANSNCLHTAGGSFAELPSSIKSFLGIKKALNQSAVESQNRKNVFKTNLRRLYHNALLTRTT